MSVGQYYLNDPAAPKPNSPTRIGCNVLLQQGQRLLLERRWDCGSWGLIGGRLRHSESYAQGISRELREETGLYLPPNAFRQLAVCDDERIAAYQDGTVWRMIIVLFSAQVGPEARPRPSRESTELGFFTRQELEQLDIVATHRDLVRRWCRGEF